MNLIKRVITRLLKLLTPVKKSIQSVEKLEVDEIFFLTGGMYLNIFIICVAIIYVLIIHLIDYQM